MNTITASQYLITIIMALSPVIVFGTLDLADKVATSMNMNPVAVPWIQVIAYILESIAVGFITYRAF